MPRYRVLRDFGSHLGNHRQGDQLSLPDGPLPRGFGGFVEAVPEPPKPASETKDITPAVAAGANPSPPAAGDDSSRPSPADPPESEEPPTPADQAQAGYSDKMVRPAANKGHGHVRPRPDGVKARCGGPAICSECALEAGKLPGRRP